MRSPWMLLISSLLLLSLSNCATTQPAPLVVDTFCQEYEPVIQQKGDAAISATDGVKRRILANEQNFRNCP